jgi:predicted ATPase
MGIERVSIEGYRSIQQLTLEPGPLTVVLGANGTGKSNLYRSLLLLQAAAQGTLARLMAEEGGIPSILWAGPRKKGPVRLSLSVRMSGLELEVVCGPVPPVPGEPPYFALDPEVKEERAWILDDGRHLVMERKDRAAFLRDADGARVTFPLSLSPGESILSQLAEPHRFPVLSALRMELLAWRFYHHFPTGPDAAARQPQVPTRTPVLSGDGRDLAAALATILLIGDGRALHRAIEGAFPGAELEVPVEPRLRVRLTQPGLVRPLEAAELSDGTLRYLCLLAALHSPRPPPLLALNEPETSLHPSLIEPLAEQIIRAAEVGQVLVTTHDEALARRLAHARGCRMVTLERRAGATVMVRGDSQER